MVQFSAASGEEESSDAGAIQVEFFELILDEFRKRSFEGPRRGDSINFLIFGIALGPLLRHGGPGVYGLQPWVFELIRGLDETDEHVVTPKTKHDTPKNAGAIDLIELVN